MKAALSDVRKKYIQLRKQIEQQDDENTDKFSNVKMQEKYKTINVQTSERESNIDLKMKISLLTKIKES